MPSCVVKCCKHNTSSQKKSSGITFHLFPKEPSRRKKWIQIVRQCRNEEYWLPSKHSRICSSHFDDTDFYTSKCGLYRLNRDATPKKTLRKSDSTTVEETKVKVETSIDEKVDDDNQYLSIMVDRDNSSESTIDSEVFDLSKVKTEDPISDHIESQTIYETPAECNLRNRVKKLQQKLKSKRKRIVLLNQKIRRLTKSNESLKNTLMGVKNKLISKRRLK